MMVVVDVVVVCLGEFYVCSVKKGSFDKVVLEYKLAWDKSGKSSQTNVVLKGFFVNDGLGIYSQSM